MIFEQKNVTFSMAEQAYNVLRKAILTGQLSPDSIWSDRELCERFKLSRTPVRESLLRLQSEELVRIEPRKGTRVMPLLVDDVREIHQVAKALELEAALLLADRDPMPDLSFMCRAIDEMERALSENDRDAWAEADTRFHVLMVGLCGNRRLARNYEAHRGLTDRARYFVLHVRELPVKSTEEHRLMYKALLNKDRQRLEGLYRLHWDRTTEEIVTLIEQYSRNGPVPNFNVQP
ncbi:GntR family transcriptional regulator [Cohaesibacter celericrescens]|uniref:GntR family transcriptional regulator n=2 Tax=Cohaesibacter celericrescens TaxID=2067669 RepID=A0A2N5XLR3_9HYPH|nr:GntR family transcriptional regulator [Cohaesibacter celericrescens]